MKRVLIPLCIALGGITWLALGQDPKPTPPPAFEKSADGTGSPAATDLFDPDSSAERQVRVQVEYIELPHQALTKLLFMDRSKSADATKLREQLQALVSKDEATVLETQIVVAKSSQKATAESIHEFIYPTEWTQPDTKTGAPPLPSAWDTRNLGGTLEVEPTIMNDSRLVDLRFVPEFVWHTGDTRWTEPKDGTAIRSPDIYTVRINSSIFTVAGQYTLAAVLSPKNDQGETDPTRKVVVLVKCDILTVR